MYTNRNQRTNQVNSELQAKFKSIKESVICEMLAINVTTGSQQTRQSKYDEVFNRFASRMDQAMQQVLREIEQSGSGRDREHRRRECCQAFIEFSDEIEQTMLEYAHMTAIQKIDFRNSSFKVKFGLSGIEIKLLL